MAIRESDFLEPGRNMVTVETNFSLMGLTICFDHRFPEIYRALTLRGAGIIFVISSLVALIGRYHWEQLLRAPAV